MAAMPQPKPAKMTEAEYLEFERASDVKHEYLYGEIYAMSGASRAHNLISGNLMAVLKTQLRGKGCEVYPSDMRIRIDARTYTYPDLSIVCGEAKLADDVFDTLTNPTVIIEVLSSSTEGYDRGKKFQHYRQIPSLQEYVLVSQNNPYIERFVRQDGGKWEFSDAIGLEATVELSSISCTLPLREVYEQVTFGEPNDAASPDETTAT